MAEPDSTDQPMLSVASTLQALLFTDIVDSSGMKARIGTRAYTALLRRHNELFDAALADHRGTLVKHTGDGVFARFPGAASAVRCALRFQRDLSAEPWAAEPGVTGEPLLARVGVHIGEVAEVRMADRDDVVGGPADVAARVMSLAVGGQVLLSRLAAEEARAHLSGTAVRWTRHGLYKLKGFTDPIEVWEAADSATTALPPPPDRLASVGVPDEAQPLPMPKSIGPYRVLEQIGKGGMGVVYKAEQRTPVKRTVAVKVIAAGFDTKEVVARFESERQALARMNHPHIAAVLDAGADDRGRPYFVMEYVPGSPITKFADDNRFTIEQRLRLFTQACDAIAHAHSKAILHRDIKAGNVLAFMDGDKPTVKVIDFGIAKALTGDRLTDRTFNTQRGDAIGTYETMSPEQAEGSPDIDTKTDVYSLGVLLYELLTGAPPFDRATLDRAADLEKRRIIRDVEPARPSTRLSALGDTAKSVATSRQSHVDALSKELRSELEWIPMMAMRKERRRRYASPLALAADVENYLADRPLEAGPESAAYKARKLFRRNRAAFVSTAAVVLLTAAGVAAYVSAVRNGRRVAEAEQRRTMTALNEVKREADFAQTLTASLRNGALAVTPNVREGRLSGRPASDALKEMFTPLLPKLVEKSDIDAGITLRTIAVAFETLGDRETSRLYCESAMSVFERVQPTGFEHMYTLSGYLFDTIEAGDPARALRMLDHVGGFFVAKNCIGKYHPEIGRLTKYSVLALDSARRYKEAEQIATSEFAEFASKPNKSRDEWGAQLWIEDSLAQHYRLVDQFDACVLHFEHIVAIARTLPGEEYRMLGAWIGMLGQAYLDRGKPGDLSKAEPLMIESLQQRRQYLPENDVELTSSLVPLGRILDSQGRFVEANKYWDEAVRVARLANPVTAERWTTFGHRLHSLRLQNRTKEADHLADLEKQEMIKQGASEETVRRAKQIWDVINESITSVQASPGGFE